MIRAIVVDDEELARRGVLIRLQRHSDIEVVGECTNGEEALGSIAVLNPDLLFLDIQMPGMTGIEMLRRLPRASSLPAIIFLTAYDEHAVAAFELHALDYLLKPLNDERFDIALGRARRLLTLERQETLCTHMDALLQIHAENTARGPAKRFIVRVGKQVAFVDTAAIDFIESMGDYSGLHLGPKTHLIRQPLHELEARLDPVQFLRIHRSAIVQVDRIARVDSLPNRDCLIKLRDGTPLRVSRTYSTALRNLLRNR